MNDLAHRRLRTPAAADYVERRKVEVLDFIGWTTAQVWQRAIELALPDAFGFYFDISAEEGDVIAFDMPADVACWRTGSLKR